MSNALIDGVKTELSDAKLEPKCPKCSSKVLYGVWTSTFKLDFDAETSEVVLGADIFLDVYCDCGWSLGGYEKPNDRKEQ